MLPIDSVDLLGIVYGSFLKGVYEKSTRLGAYIIKLYVLMMIRGMAVLCPQKDYPIAMIN